MIDLNSTSIRGAALSDAVNELIDDAINHAPGRRDYLGASEVGHVCDRALENKYRATLAGQSTAFPAKVKRIFERGTEGERMARAWLQKAGFGMGSEGLSISDHNGAFRGHVDGILSGFFLPGHECPIPLPALWENKVVKSTSWKKFVKDGVRRTSSTYYAQVQVYMLKLNLSHCLFTTVNADTMELHHELIECDPEEGARYIARAAWVINSVLHDDHLPRWTQDPASERDKWVCSYCDFNAECWGAK